MVRELKTTDGIIILMSEEVYAIACKYKWASAGGSKANTCVNGKRITFRNMFFPTGRDVFLIHLDGNHFNFSPDNVVLRSRSAHGHEIWADKTSHSRYRGVYYYSRSKSWYSRIIKDRKVIDGGHYKTEEDASWVTDYLIMIHMGEDASRNHPEASFEEVKSRYNAMYADSSIKKARGGQGVVRKKDKASKYIGVSAERTKWAARIKYNKKTIWLGVFTNEVDAAVAYDKKALELYGEGAKVNFAQ